MAEGLNLLVESWSNIVQYQHHINQMCQYTPVIPAGGGGEDREIGSSRSALDAEHPAPPEITLFMDGILSLEI